MSTLKPVTGSGMECVVWWVHEKRKFSSRSMASLPSLQMLVVIVVVVVGATEEKSEAAVSVGSASTHDAQVWHCSCVAASRV